ncbi:MAG: hypothetical protein ABI693_06355 [Bryobacteraceae bacterium]
MTTESDVMETTALLEELRSHIADLSARLQKLEAAAAPPPQVMPTPAPVVAAPAPQAAVAPVVEEEIPEEILLVIAAAVAAYFGERAHIRQVRLIRTGAWAQEGRVSIQASHRLH